MPATPAWLAAAESVLNRSISQSTPAAALAGRLNRTAIEIAVEGILRIRASVAAGRLGLTGAGDGAADATIAGSPTAFLALIATGLGNAVPTERDRRDAVQVSGDAEVAALYRDLFDLARPDFEEELSRLIGDLPARRLSLFTASLFSWARRSGQTARQNLAEYLQEESRDLVNRPELEEFLAGVDHARETADRVEARLAHLELRLKGTM